VEQWFDRAYQDLLELRSHERALRPGLVPNVGIGDLGADIAQSVIPVGRHGGEQVRPDPSGLRASTCRAIRQASAAPVRYPGASTRRQTFRLRAVVGLACRYSLGRVLLHEEFSGEAPGQANFVLRNLISEERRASCMPRVVSDEAGSAVAR
jgi:hypothetical protein